MYGSRIGSAADPQKISKSRDKDTLLEKGDLSVCSPVFYVKDTPVRLAAFGMTGSDTATVIRLWLPTEAYEKDNCGGYIAPETTLEKPLTVCGKPVALTASLDELTVDAPGAYRIHYEGGGRPNVKVVKLHDPIRKVPDADKGVCCACGEEDEGPLVPD